MIDETYRRHIVGLLAHGSVVRADFTPESDIDMVVVVDTDEAPPRQYSDGYLFIYDYFFLTRNDLASADFVLSDPHFGTVLKEGVILFDPTGVLAKAKALAEEKHDLPEYKRRRATAQLAETERFLDAMLDAYDKRDKDQFYVQYYLFGYRLMSIPLIANCVAYSGKRGFSYLEKTLEDSQWSFLVTSVASALNVEPMPEVRFPEILAALEEAVAAYSKLRSASDSSVLSFRDFISGLQRVISEELERDSLWNCFAVASAVDRTAHELPPADRSKLHTTLQEVYHAMRIESWDGIEQTVERCKPCVSEMRRYCQEFSKD